MTARRVNLTLDSACKLDLTLVPAKAIHDEHSRAAGPNYYVEKRQEYAPIGIREYWVIDRFQQKMTVFRGDDVEIVLQASDTYQTELLPGFELPVARLLTEAEFSDEVFAGEA